MRLITAVLASVLASLLAVPALAQPLSAAAHRGQAIAQANCASCHSVDRVSESPLKTAPPFRALHERYPVDNLEETLAEGIVTGHPEMPEFRFAPDQISDFITFLKALR